MKGEWIEMARLSYFQYIARQVSHSMPVLTPAQPLFRREEVKPFLHADRAAGEVHCESGAGETFPKALGKQARQHKAVAGPQTAAPPDNVFHNPAGSVPASGPPSAKPAFTVSSPGMSSLSPLSARPASISAKRDAQTKVDVASDQNPPPPEILPETGTKHRSRALSAFNPSLSLPVEHKPAAFFNEQDVSAQRKASPKPKPPSLETLPAVAMNHLSTASTPPAHLSAPPGPQAQRPLRQGRQPTSASPLRNALAAERSVLPPASSAKDTPGSSTRLPTAHRVNPEANSQAMLPPATVRVPGALPPLPAPRPETPKGPVIRIGSIDIHITQPAAPPAPPSPTSPKTASQREPLQPLAREFTAFLGLRQG